MNSNLELFVNNYEDILFYLESIHMDTSGYVEFISPVMWNLTFKLADGLRKKIVELRKFKNFTRYMY